MPRCWIGVALVACALPAAAQVASPNTFHCDNSAYRQFNPGAWLSPENYCVQIKMKQSAPGIQLGNPSAGPGGWEVSHGLAVQAVTTTPGISQTLSLDHTKTGTGDIAGFYDYTWGYGGATGKSDEGLEVGALQGGEPSHTFAGTIATGSAGATLVKVNCSVDCDHPGAGRYLIDLQNPVATGNVTGYTNSSPPFLMPGTLTVNATVPISKAWGTLAADVLTPVAAPLGVGSTSMTFALNRLGGTAPQAGDLICFAGQFHEQATIASVSGSGPYTITANLRHAHPAGSWVMDGGLCGTFIDMTAQHQTPKGQLLRWPVDIIGATAAHTLVYSYFAYGDSHMEFIWGAASTGGNGAFTLYPGAEVLDVQNESVNPPVIDGTLTLEPNTVAWSVDDSVEEPHHYAMMYALLYNNLYIYGTTGRNNKAIETDLYGAGISGSTYYDWTTFAGERLSNGNPASIYAKHGGHLNSPGGFSLVGQWQYALQLTDTPDSTLIYVNNRNTPPQPYGVFWTNNAQPINYDPSANALWFGSTVHLQQPKNAAGHVTCWKDQGQIGYCTTQPDQNGVCACN